jgi:tetratricopeptide (TPR) repeat protein
MILWVCSGYTQEKSGIGSNGEVAMQEYYYALGEATKLFMLGNYPQAVNIYNECIRVNPKSDASYYQLARIYLQAGELHLAKSNARQAVSLKPENKWYLQILADAYQMGQIWDSAILIYQRQLSLDNDNLMLLYKISNLLENSKKYDEALDYLDKIDQRIGISKETSVSRYRIYKATRQDKKALQQLKQAVDLSGGEYTLVGMQAEFFRERNFNDSAAYYYELIYPLHSYDPVVTFSYAEFLMAQKQYEKAEKVLVEAMHDVEIQDRAKAGYLISIVQDEALFNLSRPILDTVVQAFYKNSEKNVATLSVVADLSFKLGDYSKSADMLKGIIRIDKRNYPAYEQLIFCENALGDLDSVSYYSNLAIRLFPERAIPYLFGGSTAFQQEHYETAVILLENGLRRSEQDHLKVEFYSLLAECYERMQMYEKSEEYFSNALEIDQNNNGIRNNFAYYLALRNKSLSYARELSKRTIETEPRNPTYLDTYAWILFKMNKTGKAKRYIEAAIENGGQNNAEILLHYGDILYHRNNEKEALQVWKRALELKDSSVRKELEKRVDSAIQRMR